MMIVSVPDRLVRDPATRRVVDETGIDIDPTDPHWARLLADGDVATAPDAPSPSPAPAAPLEPTPAPKASAKEA